MAPDSQPNARPSPHTESSRRRRMCEEYDDALQTPESFQDFRLTIEQLDSLASGNVEKRLAVLNLLQERISSCRAKVMQLVRDDATLQLLIWAQLRQPSVDVQSSALSLIACLEYAVVKENAPYFFAFLRQAATGALNVGHRRILCVARKLSGEHAQYSSFVVELRAQLPDGLATGVHAWVTCQSGESRDAAVTELLLDFLEGEESFGQEVVNHLQTFVNDSRPAVRASALRLLLKYRWASSVLLPVHPLLLCLQRDIAADSLALQVLRACNLEVPSDVEPMLAPLRIALQSAVRRELRWGIAEVLLKLAPAMSATEEAVMQTLVMDTISVDDCLRHCQPARGRAALEALDADTESVDDNLRQCLPPNLVLRVSVRKLPFLDTSTCVSGLRALRTDVRFHNLEALQPVLLQEAHVLNQLLCHWDTRVADEALMLVHMLMPRDRSGETTTPAPPPPPSPLRSAEPLLQALCGTRSREVHWRAKEMLIQLGALHDSRLVGSLVAKLLDPDESVREVAVELINLADAGALRPHVQVLSEALRHNSAGVRGAAAAALNFLENEGPENAVSKLARKCRAQQPREVRSELSSLLVARKSQRPMRTAGLKRDLAKLFEETVASELHCAICLSPYEEPETTACGHSFCKKCIRRHLHLARAAIPPGFSNLPGHELGGPCPECRRPVRPEDLRLDRKLATLAVALRAYDGDC